MARLTGGNASGERQVRRGGKPPPPQGGTSTAPQPGRCAPVRSYTSARAAGETQIRWRARTSQPAHPRWQVPHARRAGRHPARARLDRATSAVLLQMGVRGLVDGVNNHDFDATVRQKLLACARLKQSQSGSCWGQYSRPAGSSPSTTLLYTRQEHAAPNSRD